MLSGCLFVVDDVASATDVPSSFLQERVGLSPTAFAKVPSLQQRISIVSNQSDVVLIVTAHIYQIFTTCLALF